MPTYPRIYNDNPRKMVEEVWVASKVVNRDEGGGFWARESPLRIKEKVGSVLGVAVYGGVRRWWPDVGWPAVIKRGGGEDVECGDGK